ncbi:MAG: NADH:ubiquinone reductase (Na(+)-transporting) subunit F, partial [Vicingaceae bacterium]
MSLLTILAAIVVFLIMIFLLVSILLWAKAKLTNTGPVTISINGEKDITVEAGSTLLSTLGNNKIF